ncbi:MAG: TonB-dependent receptor [Bacteroidetes bacterium HGW-Bacteroidetes-21]|jgi:outer membrane receptor for ferrienterochelin and colicin|nr:MAG: TonB-dependent receptor [Bacteroidetes bacterium HGW-Bacteroidetes-21]
MKYWLVFFALCTLSFISFSSMGQKGQIKGVITDIKSGETIVGANVLIQGSSNGTSSNLDGEYLIKEIPYGTYNLVVSYISYKSKIVSKVKIENGDPLIVNIQLEESVISLNSATVTAVRRTDSEISMISTLKASSLAVNGVSAQQISKSQDKDASEVMKRIPGITINDGRFVVVRGLSERYNCVWLNGASTPSFEADRRAFSFDLIPSGLIDNILIFKTPAPELPGDFAGASIIVYTKNIPEEKSFSISYGSSFRQNTTFSSRLVSKGGSLDWLGTDDGTRKLPDNFPSSQAFLYLMASQNQSDKQQVLDLSKELNNDWSVSQKTILPDQSLSFSLASRFTAGIFSVGNITSLNYGFSSEYRDIFRAAYQSYDNVNDEAVYGFKFNDNQIIQKSKVGLLHNWSLIYGKNNKLEFRNLINQNGLNRTTIREGYDNYGGNTIKSYEYYFLNRFTYSGQLSGENKFRRDLSKINYTLGYSYASRNEPDIRRISTTLNDEDPSSPYYGKYHVSFGFAANPGLSGRTFIKMDENILIGALNYEHQLKEGLHKPVIKTGLFIENKSRVFSARKLGYVINPFMYNDSLAYLSFDEIFNASNFNYTTGIRLDETTNKSDSYESYNYLNAGYVAIKLPVTSVFDVYTGVRLENNTQELFGYNSKNPKEKVEFNVSELRLFPSINMTYNISEKSLVRLAYGKTINRPEFREIAPFSYYDFELKAVITGNENLKNATIQNVDVRYEIYPSPAENISLAVFYKQFKNPIESVLIPTGSGLEYSFNNAPSAYSSGLELDVRQRFLKLKNNSTWIKNLADITLILNASVIKSEVQLSEDAYTYSKKRSMQGQSPYIVNAGMYYQNDSLNLGISLLYNVIGKKIVFVGDPENPDIYELPRHQVDLTINKNLTKHLILKVGIKDILNDKVTQRQTVDVEIDSNGDGVMDQSVTRDQITYQYTPGRVFMVSFSYRF